ncbi:hypothetical protein PENSPDRAFT_484086 [Peniophora sp. CONT]|nr:hypothetical protein PENSPDRAFT_484086 [Peniophora sp. CONT]
MFWERGDRWAIDAPKNKKKSAKNKVNKPKAPANSDVEEPNASSSSGEGSDSDAEDPTVASTPVRGRAQMKTGKNNIVWEYFIDAGVLPDKFGDMSSTPRVMQDYIGRMRSAWICFCFCAGDWKAIELGEYRFNTFLHNKSSKKSADRRLRLEQGRARYAFQGQHNTLYKLEAHDDNEASAPSKKRSKTEPVSKSALDALSESALDYVEDGAPSQTTPAPTFSSPEATTRSTPSAAFNVPIPTSIEAVEPTSTPMEIDDPA